MDHTEHASPEMDARLRRLYRIPDEGFLGGVCAGIADYLAIDPLVVRIVFVALTILTGGGWVVLYVLMWIFVPDIATGKAGFSSWRARRAKWRAARAKWHEEMRETGSESCATDSACPCRHTHNKCHKCHRRHGCSLFGLIIQMLFIWLVVWAIYHYLPSTQSFWHWLGDHIQTAWAWLNAKVAH